MDALKLAFDTIIVGAPALPWLALIIDFYLFAGGESSKILSPLQQPGTAVPQAISAVLLFTAAYFLGAAVSRISGDLFRSAGPAPFVRVGAGANAGGAGEVGNAP